MKYRALNNTILFDFYDSENHSHYIRNDYEEVLHQEDIKEDLLKKISPDAEWEGFEFNGYISKSIADDEDTQEFLRSIIFEKPSEYIDKYYYVVASIKPVQVIILLEKEAKKAHFDLWNFLAENSNSNPSDWKEWIKYGFEIDFSLNSIPEPIDIIIQYLNNKNTEWNKEDFEISDMFEKMFVEWDNCLDVEKNKEMAIKIRDTWGSSIVKEVSNG